MKKLGVMEQEWWWSQGYDVGSTWSLRPYFCQTEGSFAMDIEHKPVPKNQRGEWKSGCEVVLLLWSTTNTFSSSSPEVKHFIRPARKDSVSLSGPSFTVPCPGSTPIPEAGIARWLGACCCLGGPKSHLVSYSSACLSQNPALWGLCRHLGAFRSEQLIQ